ncbi:hypothetical protein Dda_2693 [Drechslerella dactyloides]|uniref:Uncharacterized protein n=1 Tax=Drechslerella dactyloides TaxID=74499 RepID=A0AAD6NKI8_DREDA|nr:hypothetical protein Dda_2693 [Drechslerella dactyloides]
MPSWPWSPRLARSQYPLRPASAPPPTPTTPASSSSTLVPWVDPESSSDDDDDDDDSGSTYLLHLGGDELVHTTTITRETSNEPPPHVVVRKFSAHHRQSTLKSATRSRTLRRHVPSFDDIANSIPEEVAPEYNDNIDTAASSLTCLNFFDKPSQENLFPGNPEDFQPIEELHHYPSSNNLDMPPASPPVSPPPRRSSNRDRKSQSPRRKDKKSSLSNSLSKVVEPDLPLLNRESCDIDEEFDITKMPSAKNPQGEESPDAEVVRLRKMCEVLQEKIIQMSQYTPPVAVATSSTPSKRSSLILGDRLSRTRLKDIPPEDLATEGHRVAHVMRAMNEQLQKKLELREKLLFQRNAHISQLERTHATQIEEFHAATKTDIQKMVSAYQKEISEMHQRNLLQITNLRNELEGKLRTRDHQSNQECARLQSEIDTLKKRESDIKASHQISMREREELFERDMALLRESITATEAEFQKNYEAKLDNLRQEHEREIAELKKEIITRPLDLSNDVDKDIVAQKIIDLEGALATHIEELTSERERALELQVALDASEFGRQTDKEKLEAAVREEATKREEFQKHEQRIRAQLLAASDEKRKECLKHERSRYERLVREENIRRKAASDRYEGELKELKQKNAEQVELFRMQKESIFELHEKDVQELEKRLAAERSKVAEYETLLETVKSSREEDLKRFEGEKAELVAVHMKEKESFAQEKRVMAAAQARDQKLASAEKEALESDLKRMSSNCEELLHRRVRDSIGSSLSRRSYTPSESVTSVSDEDETERRIAAEVAKVTAHSESQQKASTEAYERQCAVLKAELQALQKLQTRINTQIAEDEKKISELTLELEGKKDEIERQASIIADLELQLESEKGKFKNILERNVSLEKRLWEQKEAADETAKVYQNQIKTLSDENQTLLATIASAGIEDERDAGMLLKEAISAGYETELRELESRHKEVIQTNINSIYQLENLVRHYACASGDPPRSPSFVGTPQTPYFLGEGSAPAADNAPSLTTARSASSAGSVRSVPLHEPSFETIYEPTFEPAVVKENSKSEADYIEALRKAEAASSCAAQPSEDRNELLLAIQTQIRSFKIQQLSFPAASQVKAA